MPDSGPTAKLVFDVPILADSLALGAGSSALGAGFSIRGEEADSGVATGTDSGADAARPRETESLAQGVAGTTEGQQRIPGGRIQWSPRGRHVLSAVLQPAQALPRTPEPIVHQPLRRPVQMQPVGEELPPSLQAEFAAVFHAERRRLEAVDTIPSGEDAERKTAEDQDPGTAVAQGAPPQSVVSRMVGEWERLHDGELRIYSVEPDGKRGYVVSSCRRMGGGNAGTAPQREQLNHSLWASADSDRVLWGHGEVSMDAACAGKSVITWRHRDGRTWQWVRRQLAPLPAPVAEPVSSVLNAAPARAAHASADSVPLPSAGAGALERSSASVVFAGRNREKALITVSGGIIDAFLCERRASGYIPLTRTLGLARQAALKGDVVGVALKLAEAEDLDAPQPGRHGARPRRIAVQERRLREDVVLLLFAEGEAVEWPRIRRLLLQQSDGTAKGH